MIGANTGVQPIYIIHNYKCMGSSLPYKYKSIYGETLFRNNLDDDYDGEGYVNGAM